MFRSTNTTWGKIKSDGRMGEQLAEVWFRQNGWKMVRHQPATRVIRLNGKPTIINCGRGGVADYTGYEVVYLEDQNSRQCIPFFRAVEVKEAYGLRMPASRLDKKQREWLDDIDERSAFVGVCWMDNPIQFEVFQFIPKGAYCRGEGIKRQVGMP